MAVTAKEGLVVGVRSMPEVLCGAGHKLKMILAGALAGAFAGLHGLARHRRNDAADAIAPSSTSC